MKKRCGTLLILLIQTCFYGEKARWFSKDEKTPRSSAASFRGKVFFLLGETAIMGNSEIIYMFRTRTKLLLLGKLLWG